MEGNSNILEVVSATSVTTQNIKDKAVNMAEFGINTGNTAINAVKNIYKGGKSIKQYTLQKRKKAAIEIQAVHNQFGIKNGATGVYGINVSSDGNGNGVFGLLENQAEKKIANGGLTSVVNGTNTSFGNNVLTTKNTINALKAPSKVLKGARLMKNAIRHARLKEFIASAHNPQQMAVEAGRGIVNTIISGAGFIVKNLIKGMSELLKKALTLILGPAYSIFCAVVIIVVVAVAAVCVDDINAMEIGSLSEMSKVGKVNGIRVSMEGIENNPWYTTKNPFHQSGYGMVPRKSSGKGNCTCYAWGRRAEITGEAPKLSTGNASAWYNYNKTNKIYKYGSVPKPGAVCCWKGGSDGSGHVAVVEVVNDDGSFTISESSWTRFFFRTRAGMKADSMNEGNLIFQGFIYMDAYDE